MTNYPLNNSHFMVEWGGTSLGFLEVIGLGASVEVIEFREGSSPDSTLRKMPGIKKYGNIIFKRAIRKNDNEFFDWFNTIHMSAVERRNIVISLLNDAHEPVVRWKLSNTFPVRIEYSALNSTGNGPAVELIEVAHEGIKVEMG
ncbi:MAG: phage tail protein [Weeksellaceae bacterium]